MGVAERRTRDRAEREQRIVAAAAAIAERDGWDAVTIRRLAEAIEYSQPVLYAHFANREAIVAAVAVEGFRELAAVLRAAARVASPADGLKRAACAYLDFAAARPALYEAMFTLQSGLRFAEGDTRPELREAFEALAASVKPLSPEGRIATEVVWGGLHGMALLEGAGRIPAAARGERVALFCAVMTRIGER